MSENQQRTDAVKGSNLGFIVGILVVVAVTMLILNTSFVQEKIGKKSENTSTDQVEVGGFEFVDEPEITLLDENQVEEVELVAETEEVDTHAPVDTAIGDVNMVLLSSVLFGGAGLFLMASKKLVS